MGAHEGTTTSRTDQAVGPAGDTYAMGRSEAESERLIRQSGLYAPFTRRLFEQAGLRPGMRALDVGTGAGDVALIAAEMVGASGGVVGVDHNPEVLATARSKAAAIHPSASAHSGVGGKATIERVVQLYSWKATTPPDRTIDATEPSVFAGFGWCMSTRRPTAAL